jgi:hypothetical protein
MRVRIMNWVSLNFILDGHAIGLLRNGESIRWRRAGRKELRTPEGPAMAQDYAAASAALDKC